jgi:hypothetical protein
MTNLNTMFPRRYATGADLNNKPVTVTIKAIAQEQMRPHHTLDVTKKWVAYFIETEKGVILSRTLAGQIAAVVGSEDIDAWIGSQVTLYPEPMVVAGTPRIAIRARKPSPGNGAPTPELTTDDDDFVAEEDNAQRKAKATGPQSQKGERTEFYALASAAMKDQTIGGADINQIIDVVGNDDWPQALAMLKEKLGVE